MHAESLARAEYQPQQTIKNGNESGTMIDLTRDGLLFLNFSEHFIFRYILRIIFNNVASN